MTASGQRSALIARAKVLRAAGRTYQQIADELGMGRTTVHVWLTDPDGAKARALKLSYAGTCEICGGPTSGSNGRRAAPKRCHVCSRRTSNWTRTEIVAAIIRFYERYGRQPTSTDFNPSLARIFGHHGRADRFHRDGDYPYTNAVQREFGKWNTAVQAAGFQPLAQGEYPRLAREGGGCAGAHLLRDEPSRP